ncbi:MAG TPA: methyltransferase [Caulobacteraceae bacterium]|nr:methyltransferase [Caulobacteraceae bacterium]
MAAEAVYGLPPAGLATSGPDAIQVSPLIVGASAIESLADASLDRLVIAAPPGTLERRYVLAHGLRALREGGEIVALAPKAKGGARLGGELAGFGCEVRENARRHQRICRAARPARLVGAEAAIAAGGPRIVPALGLWSQPGVFSWDRLDPGTALLLAQRWTPAGNGADFGCGYGALARAVLASPAVTRLALIDIDRRALDAARRNIDDQRAHFLHCDLRRPPPSGLGELDFVIMNPPFHDGGAEDRSLGQALVATAAAMLGPGGLCRLVANVALPYETTLAASFAHVALVARGGGYKVLEARR